MKLNRNDYTVEAAAGGGFYAYFMNNVLCSAYGETPRSLRKPGTDC